MPPFVHAATVGRLIVVTLLYVGLRRTAGACWNMQIMAGVLTIEVPITNANVLPSSGRLWCRHLISNKSGSESRDGGEQTSAMRIVCISSAFHYP